MYDPLLVLAVVLVYVGLLFLVALWVERGSPLGRRLAASPVVYALALAVYCTTWSFYGGVGSAASSGVLFLGLYLGPACTLVFGWFVVRKLARIEAAKGGPELEPEPEPEYVSGEYPSGEYPSGEYPEGEGAGSDHDQERGTVLSRQAEELEALVAERTRMLEVAAEVAQATAVILDPERLISEVVDLIRDRFGLYYVGLFLVDEGSQWAVLHAGTGSAGVAMLERGHRIRVGEGMVGWSIAHGEWRVAAEVGQDGVHLATPELPETRSEAALPLRSRDRVLGALTVQDTRAGAFDENRLMILQMVTDQVGVALDNARLFSESQQALEAQRRAYGEVSSKAWLQMARARPDWGYYSDHRGVASSTGEWQPWMGRAVVEDRTVVSFEDGASVVAIPVRVRGRVVGALDFHKAEPSAARTGATAGWTQEEVRLLETLTDQLGIALESAQLYADTRVRAARERLLGEVTARVRETLDLETVMRTAAVQIREALNLPEVAVRLRQGGSALDAGGEPAAARDNGDGE